MPSSGGPRSSASPLRLPTDEAWGGSDRRAIRDATRREPSRLQASGTRRRPAARDGSAPGARDRSHLDRGATRSTAAPCAGSAPGDSGEPSRPAARRRAGRVPRRSPPASRHASPTDPPYPARPAITRSARARARSAAPWALYTSRGPSVDGVPEDLRAGSVTSAGRPRGLPGSGPGLRYARRRAGSWRAVSAATASGPGRA